MDTYTFSERVRSTCVRAYVFVLIPKIKRSYYSYIQIEQFIKEIVSLRKGACDHAKVCLAVGARRHHPIQAQPHEHETAQRKGAQDEIVYRYVDPRVARTKAPQNKGEEETGACLVE